MHVGFLTTPIIGCLIMGPIVGWDKTFGLWLLFRANTLTFGGIMQIGGKKYWEESLHNDKFSRMIDFTHKTWVQIVCMVICIALMLFVMISRFTSGTFGWVNPYVGA